MLAASHKTRVLNKSSLAYKAHLLGEKDRDGEVNTCFAAGQEVEESGFAGSRDTHEAGEHARPERAANVGQQRQLRL